MAKATTSKQSKTTKKPVASKKPAKTEKVDKKKTKGSLLVPPEANEDDADAELLDPKAKGGVKIAEDGEKALDPDLLIGDEPVAPVEPEEVEDADTEEEDEDAVIDPDEMNPFGDKWEE